MRIAIGSVIQESNSFVPFRTTLDTFRAQYLFHGEEMLTRYGEARIEVPGMLSVLRAAGATPLPLIGGFAGSSGPLTRACFEAIAGEMVERLRAQLPVDGVLLALHGAMAVEDEDDAEGELIARVRAAAPPGTPIGVSLDLHGHITPRMLHPDVFLVGYREFPHIDMFETGERVALLLLDRLAGRRRPVMAMTKKPMLVSPVAARTGEGPLAEVVVAARAMENSGRVLHASLFPVQPWLDFVELGFTALVCADGDARAAQAAADELAEMVWLRRERLLPTLTPLDKAIRVGLTSPGLTVVGDCGDAPSSGAGGDNAAVLRALLAAGAAGAPRLTYVTLVDAPAATAAADAGIGATLDIRLGHTLSPGEGEPVAVTARVRVLTDGEFVMADAGAEGNVARMGPTTVLDVGALRVAVRSEPSYEWDTGIYTSVGLELRKAALVFVKSPAHFRVAFGPVARRILIADTPGPTCGNIRRVKFTRLKRPVHPLDAI